jgi:hypothetical protein
MDWVAKALALPECFRNAGVCHARRVVGHEIGRLPMRQPRLYLGVNIFLDLGFWLNYVQSNQAFVQSSITSTACPSAESSPLSSPDTFLDLGPVFRFIRGVLRDQRAQVSGLDSGEDSALGDHNQFKTAAHSAIDDSTSPLSLRKLLAQLCSI